MTHAFLCVGMKGGDLLSVLPIIRHRWSQTGQKQTVIVPTAYLPIAIRAPYVNPLAWPGNWEDLREALGYAKRSFDRVTCLATYGKDFPIQKRLPGFQLDQWDRAGMIDQWDQLEHELEKSDPICDLALPTILVGDYSESSPFPAIEELVSDLAARFPNHKIVRLSSVRLENPCDLIPLFDQADAMVSVETMMLHLSKFSTVPTIALVTDKPSRWHGSTWSKKFRMHVRYSDYEQRRQDILQAVADSVNKIEPLKIEPLPHAPGLAYNPSILWVGDKLWTSWRFHPDPKSWRTDLFVHDGEKTWPVIVEGFEKYSAEDARLFMFKGKPHLSFTLSRSPIGAQKFSPCVTAYGELVKREAGFVMSNFYRPQFGKNDWTGQEKNLVFFEYSKSLFCIWQCAPEQIVLELQEGRVLKVHRSTSPECAYGHPRGGTQPFLFDGDKMLRFVHCNQRNPKSDQWWTYSIAAILQDAHPPFAITHISKRPVLIGNEQFFPNHPQWKPRCVLPFGAVREGKAFRVAFGLNDSACCSVLVTEKEMNL